MEKIQRTTHTIDASGKALGRLATEIVILLRGKNKPNFVPYSDMGDEVVITNIKDIKFTGKKIDQKMYFSHSPYLGSGKETPLRKVFNKKPSLVLQRAVMGMLPKNKLRAKMIKRLKIS
jgi:large subunit ribosomal protein L13